MTRANSVPMCERCANIPWPRRPPGLPTANSATHVPMLCAKARNALARRTVEAGCRATSRSRRAPVCTEIPGAKAHADDRAHTQPRGMFSYPTAFNASATGAALFSVLQFAMPAASARRQLQHRADQCHDDAERQVALGCAALLGGRRHGIEADTGEEDDGGSCEHASKTVRPERMPMLSATASMNIAASVIQS